MSNDYAKAIKEEERRMAEHLHNFNVKHQDADELICDKDGKILSAVYHSYHGKNVRDMKSFFKRVSELAADED